MNRKSIFSAFIAFLLLLPAIALAADKPAKSASRKGWKLAWKDEFNGNKLNLKNWTRYTRDGKTDWDRHMSGLDSLCRVE
ncbi:MAG: hypothetical protein J6Q45_03875, partial [Alistipes sp.]|nr:hypothetical protein [Alistipes sp.]